ncbi:MAG: hypothetical protein ACI89U_002084 [Gammaproteobacteria bacterium]|jgi:hypothetical protein
MTSEKVVFESSSGRLSWVDNTYLYLTYHDIGTVTQDDTSAFYVAISEQFDYKVPLVIERIFRYAVSEDAFQFAKDFSPLYLSAIALVDDKLNAGLAQSYAVDRISRFTPTAGFKTVDAAVDWIRKEQFDSKESPTLEKGLNN